jgi:uncharacterized membrane protein YGL010W
MARTAREWLDAYAVSHQNPTNQKIHFVCIPAIMTSLIGLLWSIPLTVLHPFINPGTALVAGGLVYYLLLSPRHAIGMAGLCALALTTVVALAHLPVPLWASCLVIFAGAWMLQFIGHKIEGKKPSFLEDLQFLMIGPMWEIDHLYRRLGVR